MTQVWDYPRPYRVLWLVRSQTERVSDRTWSEQVGLAFEWLVGCRPSLGKCGIERRQRHRLDLWVWHLEPYLWNSDMNVFGTSVCHVYVHCCSLNTPSSKWTRKIRAGSTCDSQTGKPGRFLRVCSRPPRSCGGSELALALGRERMPWVGLIRQVTPSFIAAQFPRSWLTLPGCWNRITRVRTYKKLLCPYRMGRDFSNLLKEIGYEYRECKTRSTNREGRLMFDGEFGRIGARDSLRRTGNHGLLQGEKRGSEQDGSRLG